MCSFFLTENVSPKFPGSRIPKISRLFLRGSDDSTPSRHILEFTKDLLIYDENENL